MNKTKHVNKFFTFLINGNDDKAKKMLENGKLDLHSFEELNLYTLVGRIISSHNTRGFDLIKEYGCDFNKSPVHRFDSGINYLGLASKWNFTNAIDYFLSQKVGYDPNDFAPVLRAAVTSRDLPQDYIDVFIEKTQDINSQDKDGRSALMLACRQGRFDVIKALVKADADVCLRDKNGNTALHFLTEYATNESYDETEFGKVLDLLIDNGLEVNVVNNAGDAPLTKLFSYPERLKPLLERGANPLFTDQSSKPPLLKAACHEYCAGSYKAFEVMMDYLPEGDYSKALSAVSNSEANILFYLKSDRENFETHLDALLARGADINSQRKDGQTLLHLSYFSDNAKKAEILLARGADLFIKDKDGRTPLRNIAYNKNIDCLEKAVQHLPENFSRQEVKSLKDQMRNSPFYEYEYKKPVAVLENALKETGWITGYSGTNDLCVAYVENDSLLGERITHVFNFLTRERYTKFEPLAKPDKESKAHLNPRQPIIEVFNEGANIAFWRQAAEVLAANIEGAGKKQLQNFLENSAITPSKRPSVDILGNKKTPA